MSKEKTEAFLLADDFSTWTFGELEEILRDVPHGTVVRALEEVRVILRDAFTAMAREGEWSLSPRLSPDEGAESSLSWFSGADERNTWDIEFPFTPRLHPSDIVASVAREAETAGWYTEANKAEILDALVEWRDAIETAIAAVREMVP